MEEPYRDPDPIVERLVNMSDLEFAANVSKMDSLDCVQPGVDEFCQRVHIAWEIRAERIRAKREEVNENGC
jgi:hypothetical protein